MKFRFSTASRRFSLSKRKSLSFLGAIAAIVLFPSVVVRAEEPGLNLSPKDVNVELKPWIFLGRNESVVAEEQTLGVTIAPADAILRSHLELPDDRGLVITNLTKGGAGEEIGLALNDILLAVEDKPVSDAETLRAALAGVKDSLRIEAIRRGKPLKFEIPKEKLPKSIVSLAASDVRHRYWIGVNIAEADETLRSQLRLGQNQGLVVTVVVAGSPAASAGLVANDLLLELNGKSLSKFGDLVKGVEELGEKEGMLKLLRQGERHDVRIKPTVNPQTETNAAAGTIHAGRGFLLVNGASGQGFETTVEKLFVGGGLATYHVDFSKLGPLDVALAETAQQEPSGSSVDQKLDGILAQLKRLADRLEALERTSQAPSTKPADGR